MNFTLTIKVLQKRIETLQVETALAGAKEDQSEQVSELVFLQSEQENFKRDIAEIQEAIQILIKSETKNQNDAKS